MRTDLTAAFIAAKNSAERKPRQLLVFQFPTAGNVYVSDQEITLGGVTYRPLVESWGELRDASGSESDISAETRQVSLTLWNGGGKPFSEYFLQEDPENVEVLLYQWFVGLADADKALLERFVVQDPIRFDEASRLLTLDLVSVNMRYVGKCGYTVRTDWWPYALPEHVGQPIPLVIGDAGPCNTLCVRTARKVTLFGSIAKGSMTIACNESLAKWPASGILQIEEELIQYSSRSLSGNVFYVSVRGYGGTEKESHPDGSEVYERITDHAYVIGEVPIASITDVKVDGHPAPAGTYSISMTSGFGRIIFNQKPYSYRFSPSAQSIEEFGFVTASDNTAWQPHYAYDQNKTSSSALINEVYKTLSINLPATYFLSEEGMGLLTTAYLTVHHWETNTYLNDYVEVWVEGIGVVGRLARPSESDIFDLEAATDIDHPHGYKDPVPGTSDPTHPHAPNADLGYSANGDPTTVQHIRSSNGAYSDIVESVIWFNNLAHTGSGAMISMNVATQFTGTARVDYIELIPEWGQRVVLSGFGAAGPQGAVVIAGGQWPRVADNQNYWLKVRTYMYMNNGSVQVNYQAPVIQYNFPSPQTSSANTGVTAYTASAGNVSQLLTDNRQLEILSKKSPSRTLIDRFDLSDFIDPSWSWFTGRKVQVRYVGTTDDVNVFIPFICFEMEYRKRERVYSDRVTATVSGNPSRRPDQVLQALLAKAGVPPSYIDTASFADAGDWYDANGYTIDGVIDGGSTVAEAIKNVCRQARSRLYWSAGKARLSVRHRQADWTIARHLAAEHYQQRSIQATRQSIQDLVNRIELFYKIDRVQDQTSLLVASPKGGEPSTIGHPYQAVARRDDAGSIAAHGVHESRDGFLFDLVRGSGMAESLADYYLSTLSYPSTLYEFNCYLEQLDLEKEDVLSLTSAGFHKIRKMPMRVKEVARLFGSGKNKTINHLRIIAECLRYILLEQSAADAVLVFDSLTATVGKLTDIADQLHIMDYVSSAETVSSADTAVIEDTLETLWAIVNELSEAVSVADTLTLGIEMRVDEQVVALESLDVWRNIGFGSQDFGLIGFGGMRNWNESNPDELVFADQLGAALGTYTDDEVSVQDALAASTGFGSPGNISDGYAYQPFGG
ncbi:MAG: hypothetical protein ACYCYR_09640 [Desulfobulbaceae bacterium]